MVIVLMGPAGSGKTTVGRALARSLDWSFYDADDLHSRGSIEKMRRGAPLDDADRLPWLEQVRQIIEDAVSSGRSAVVAASALRERYRQRLADGLDGVRFVFLATTPGVLRHRLVHRTDHFAPVELLESQLAALEPPDNALTVDAAQPVAALVATIRAALL